jgi:hypothetical protein
MAGQRKSPLEFSVEDLDRELIARGAQIPEKKLFKFKDREGTPERDVIMSRTKEIYETPPPTNESLAGISTWDLVKILLFKTGSIIPSTRGIWSDDLMDCYELTDEPIKNNADCTAIICLKDNLTDKKNGFSTLKVKNYGKTFNLCDAEPFYDQPISAGISFSGFLVKENVIAAAGHCVNKNNLTDLRIVFGYKMLDPTTPVTQVSNENIYKGVRIIHKVLNHTGNKSDWALVKLDRKVVGPSVPKLSGKRIFSDQPVYVIGHPVGLPLKYTAGASVRDAHETYFVANLNIYSGNSGSPIFNRDTNEVIGMVVRGYNRDFRWTGKCWLSIGRRSGIYGDGAHCTRVSEFIKYC